MALKKDSAKKATALAESALFGIRTSITQLHTANDYLTAVQTEAEEKIAEHREEIAKHTERHDNAQLAKSTNAAVIKRFGALIGDAEIVEV